MISKETARRIERIIVMLHKVLEEEPKKMLLNKVKDQIAEAGLRTKADVARMAGVTHSTITYGIRMGHWSAPSRTFGTITLNKFYSIEEAQAIADKIKSKSGRYFY